MVASQRRTYHVTHVTTYLESIMVGWQLKKLFEKILNGVATDIISKENIEKVF